MKLKNRGKGNMAIKWLGITEYKHVGKVLINNETYYKARISKLKWFDYFTNEKEAAKAVDLKLIKHNLKPVNFFKKINLLT